MFDVHHFLDSSAQFISAGLFISDGEWIHPARVINSYEMIFVVQGTVLIGEGDAEYAVCENEALFLRQGVPHRGLRPTTEPVSFYWLHFDFPDGPPPSLYDPHYKNIPGSNIRILLKQLLHYAHTPQYPKQCCNYLLRLAVTEALLSRTSGSVKGTAVVKEMQEWVRIHYDQKITLDDLAAEFGYNKDYITKLFKKHLSMGVKQYIDYIKMNKAKEWILSGSYSFKSISSMLGIGDYNCFLKMFKYHEGITPKQYREAYINIHINRK